MPIANVVKRGVLAVIVVGALAEIGSLAYSRHVLNAALAPGASVPLAGSRQRLVYRSRDFTAGWLDGAGHGDLVFPNDFPGHQGIVVPVTLHTQQGIGLDGSVVRIAAEVKLPPKLQEQLDHLNDPVPVTAELRIFPWKSWALQADFKPAWGNVGLLEVNFAGASYRLKRGWSSIRSDVSVGRLDAYRGDRNSPGFAQDSLHFTTDSVVAKGMLHGTLSLTASGIRLGAYTVPSVTVHATGDTLAPFYPKGNYLLAPPTSSGSVIHFTDVEVRAENKGLLKANADFTIPPFAEGNLVGLVGALAKGFKARTSIDFDSAFSTYFHDFGATLSRSPEASPVPSLCRLKDGHYLCDLSFEDGKTVINGKDIPLPGLLPIPGLLLGQRGRIVSPSIPAPALPSGAVPPDIGRSGNAQMLVRPISPQLVPNPQRLNWLPFRLGEPLSEVRLGLAQIGSRLPIGDGSVPSVRLARQGIWLFFTPDETVRTIRLDSPFAGKVQGIALGDSEARLLSVMGTPVRPPWPFAGHLAYLYQGTDGMVRYDVGNGRVQTIFEVAQATAH